MERFSRDKRWVVVETYKDEGWSGSVMARPELDRLRDDARVGRFQAVLINDVDRLARDVAHLGIIKRDLEKQNVQVIFPETAKGSESDVQPDGEHPRQLRRVRARVDHRPHPARASSQS